MGAARDFGLARFGGPTTPVERSVSVGLGATELARGNPDRLKLDLVNFGSADVIVKPGRGVSTTNGFRIPPGGTLSWRVDLDGEVLADRFDGISTAAAQTVFVQELVRIVEGG